MLVAKGMRLRRVLVAVVAVALASCAVTPQQFAQQRYSLSDLEVCRAAISAAKSSDYNFQSITQDEARRRGLAPESCARLVKEANEKAVAAAAVVIGVIAIAAAARKGGGGSSYAPTTGVTDTDWSWDLFYNEYRQSVWACRGHQTGRFAELSRCEYKPKIDSRWPSLEAPRISQ